MSLRPYKIVIYVLIGFAIVNTVVAVFWLVIPNSLATQPSPGGPINGTSPQDSLLRIVVSQTPTLALGGWGLVGVASLWYQRSTSIWKKMGFDSDVFRLFMRTKGGPTRVRLLQALSKPKNRLELAEELGYDWNVIDRHIKILLDYGIIGESSAYGNVRLYQLTKTGETLLRLIEDLHAAESSLHPPSAV